MPSSSVVLNEDACPVGDDLLGSLYRTHENGLAELVETVSPDVRAMLALFCYRRAHLHSMSLAIAATCDRRDLTEQGGLVGEMLFTASRDASPAPVNSGQSSSRRGVTLSTMPLSSIPPMMDDIDDDEPEQASA